MRRYLKYAGQLYELVDSVNDKIQMQKVASQLDAVVRDVSNHKDTIVYTIERQISRAKATKDRAMKSSDVKSLRELETAVKEAEAMRLGIKRFFDTYSKYR